MKFRAFTLIEILLATVLAATLLGGVMLAAGAIARDARRQAPVNLAADERAFELLRWDIGNAEKIETAGEGRSLTLTGHGGIDRDSLQPNGRLAEVSYRVIANIGLVREQRYLDDPGRPQVWSDLVLNRATRIETSVEPALKVRITFSDRSVVERTMVQ